MERPKKTVKVSHSLPELLKALETNLLCYILDFLSLKDQWVFSNCSKVVRECLKKADRLWKRFSKLLLYVDPIPRYVDQKTVMEELEQSHVYNKTYKTWSLDIEGARALRSVCFGEGVCYAGDTRSVGATVYAFKEPTSKTDKVNPRKYEWGAPGKISVNSLLFRNGKLFSGLSRPESRCICFDVESGDMLASYPQHKDSIFAIAANDNLLASGGGQTDCNCVLSDLETTVQMKSYCHKGSVRGIDLHEHSICTGSLDGNVRLFDLRTPSEDPVRTVKFPSTAHGVVLCRENPNLFVVSTGRSDNSVYLSDYEGNKTLITSHRNGVSSIVVNSQLVCSADYNGELSFSKKYGSRRETIVKKGCGSEIHCIAATKPGKVFHADGGSLVFHKFSKTR